MRTRSLGIRAAAVLAAVALASCGDDGDTAGQSAAKAGTAGYPVTISNCGRKLTFDEAPSRAVLSYHPMAEIFVGLGLAERAVGRAGYQSGGHGQATAAPTLPEQAADFKRIPVVSDNVFPPTKEKMLSLRPDFLLAYGDFDYSGDQGLASLKQLGAAGIRVYTVQCGDEAPLSDTYRVISDLGKIFGVSDRAEARIAQMRKQIADVQAAVAGEPPVRVFAYFGGKGPLSALGAAKGLPNALFTLAGAKNALDDTDAFVDVSLEAVAGSDVEAYIIDTSTDELDEAKAFLYKSFPSLKATKDQRYAAFNFTFSVQGWRNAQTVEDLARELHPDAFDG